MAVLKTRVVVCTKASAELVLRSVLERTIGSEQMV